MIRWTIKTRLYLSVILFMICQILFNIVLIPELVKISHKGMLDMMYYNGQIFKETIEAYGASGLLIYNQLQLLDFVFPMIYGVLFYTLMQIGGMKYKYMVIVVVILDYLENLSIRWFILYPSDVLPTYTFAFTALKFIGFALVCILITRNFIKRKIKNLS